MSECLFLSPLRFRPNPIPMIRHKSRHKRRLMLRTKTIGIVSGQKSEQSVAGITALRRGGGGRRVEIWQSLALRVKKQSNPSIEPPDHRNHGEMKRKRWLPNLMGPARWRERNGDRVRVIVIIAIIAQQPLKLRVPGIQQINPSSSFDLCLFRPVCGKCISMPRPSGSPRRRSAAQRPIRRCYWPQCQRYRGRIQRIK